MYMAMGTSGSYNWGYIGKGSLSADYTTNLTSWYDASDSLTPTTNGSTLTGWNDKGSQLNHLTTVFGTPQYMENVQNGLPAAYFDGNNEAIYGANQADINQPNTHFVVFKPTNWGTGGIQYVAEMQPNGQAIQKSNAAATVGIYSGAALAGNSISNNTAYLATAIFNGTSSSIQINNAAAVTGNAGTSANSNSPRMGTAHDGSGDYTGYVMEWRVYSGALSSAIQDQIRAILNNKWAIY